MVPRYTHESEGWPHYRWDNDAFAAKLSSINFRRGALMTAMATLGFEVRQEAVLQVLVQDVTKSSEIEGEKLDAEQVRSSIARRLGMEYAGLPVPARDVEGVVEMMLDATQRYAEPLDAERIFGWHAALFPTGRSGLFKIVVGAWRDDRAGPMQVVSGPIGREKVHFEAPAAERVPAAMAEFLRWFETEPLDPVVKAAGAHLWFVTIHPMDDGNGRIGRAIMDMALARADGDHQRFDSVTAQIHRDKNAYYDILERTQRRTLDITEWIVWFLDCLSAALESAEGVLDVVRRKQTFWDAHRDDGLNERQIKIVNMLFEGFNGKLQTGKYAKIAKCSNATALRDLNELVEKEVLAVDPSASGRSTSYVLA
jgi:Fic family protein